MKCLYCKRVLIKNAKTFCSVKCQRGQEYETYIEKWLRHEITGLRAGGHISNHIRHYLIDLYGESCWKCDWDEKNPVTGKVPLEVNHIDGNYRNCFKENLELICPNCHALTPNYKNLNKGHGRKKVVQFLPS